MDDPHKLQRFLEAQAPVYGQVCTELSRGRKTSHWIWFIFPQLKGLGSSSMAARYAIASLEEAKAYVEHPVLGARLRECCTLLLGLEQRSIEEIVGHPDDLKLRSCVTLFGHATADNEIFLKVLHRYFDGEPDRATEAGLFGGNRPG